MLADFGKNYIVKILLTESMDSHSIAFAALDCQQFVWSGLLCEWSGIPAVKQSEHRLYFAWWSVCVRYLLGVWHKCHGHSGKVIRSSH